MSTELVKSPMLMLQEQLDKGTSVQDLKALMDMAERWNELQAQQAWNLAMTNCQRDMPALVKNKTNTHTGKKYTSFDQLDRQIKPIYLREGFSLCFTEIPQENLEVCCMALDVLHEKGHVRRFTKNVHVDGKGTKGNTNMTPTQADGSTASYARRYVTEMAFNLAREDEDVDGDYGSQGLVSEAELKLLTASITETTVTTGLAVDTKALLRFASPDIKGFGDMNREQYLRVMNWLGLQRHKAQSAEKAKR